MPFLLKVRNMYLRMECAGAYVVVGVAQHLKKRKSFLKGLTFLGRCLTNHVRQMLSPPILRHRSYDMIEVEYVHVLERMFEYEEGNDAIKQINLFVTIPISKRLYCNKRKDVAERETLSSIKK